MDISKDKVTMSKKEFDRYENNRRGLEDIKSYLLDLIEVTDVEEHIEKLVLKALK